MQIKDKTINALVASLNFRLMRQEVLNTNIANSETPDFKAKRLDFESALSRALDVDGKMQMNTSDSRHFDVGSGGFANIQPEIYDDPNGIVSPDGNTVNRDQEMVKMAENKLMYDATVQLLNKKLALLKYAIQSEK